MSTITGSVSPKRVTYDYEYSDDEDSQLGPLQQEWPFGGKGRSKDVPVPEGEKCQATSKLLANADRQAGEYSFGGRADTLPNVLGLVVKDVGPVSVPLTEEEATNLITKSKKSPFGHKFETKMDENVRNSWQLEPDQVEITNPQWSTGIKELTATIAARLGYEGVPLSCQLYKMLIYGQGGHFVKHQDTEKEDGMIATLVVQLPSLHEGGDLVIYRGGEPLYRHDFGKADGSAGYFPHYAVHYADAEHSLETVAKGYRLVLVYSLCLPAKMVYLKKSQDKLLSDGLAEAVGGMGTEDESFALLLEHEYTEKSIGDLGVGALKGIDRARFSALKGANDVVPADKQLQFFIVLLTCEVGYCSTDAYELGGWQDGGREHDVRWFSTTGESFGSCSTSSGMNFLNPGHEAYAVLWRPHGSSTVVGYLGNEGGSMDTKYSRYAIKAWPAAQGVKTALRLSNVTVAAKCLQSQKPVGAVKLREFMELATVELDKEEEVSTTFFQTLSELLVDTGDVSLVDFFFTNIYKGRLDLAAPLIPIVRKFAWDDIGPILSCWLDGADEGKAMVVLLNIAEGLGLDKGAAPTALVKLASERALELSCDELISFRYSGSGSFDVVTNK